MEILLVFLALPLAAGAFTGWAIASYIGRTFLRRGMLFAVAFAPIVYFGIGLSTACKAEREIGFTDCDDDEVWGAAFFGTGPAWLLATLSGAAFLPRRKEPEES